MFRRFLRLTVAFILALVVTPWLPLFIERTFLRSWRVDRLGDQIDWGWKLVSLHEYWSNYRYMNREQRPALWLAVDVGLMMLYAFVFAVLIDQIFERLKKGRQ